LLSRGTESMMTVRRMLAASRITQLVGSTGSTTRRLVHTTLPCGCASHAPPPDPMPRTSIDDPIPRVAVESMKDLRNSMEDPISRKGEFKMSMDAPPEKGEGMFDIADFMEGNRRWVEENEEWFKLHGHKKQEPKCLWIGCSDARVPANQVIGQPVGAVFVHRNIANLVVSADMNIKSVIQYAVSVLKVPHIIVCGHYDCGGVKAAMAKTPLDSNALGSPIEDWLHNIRDVSRLHSDELEAITDPDLKHRRLVELNVIEQCLNIFKLGVVQRRRLMTSQVAGAWAQPRVHGLVYCTETGRLINLAHDFRAERKKLGKHYELFQ
jgi:carbonic anhydrase